MPKLKDFEKKNSAKKNKHEIADEDTVSTQKSKRRPGRDVAEGETESHSSEAEYVRTIEDQSTQESAPSEDLHTEAQSENSESKSEAFKMEFYGSEILRQKAPEVFELAEAVAEDWVKDGDFKALPLKNPWAQMAASQGLQKAKQVEKKLDELGVIPMAKMGFEFLKAKIKK